MIVKEVFLLMKFNFWWFMTFCLLLTYLLSFERRRRLMENRFVLWFISVSLVILSLLIIVSFYDFSYFGKYRIEVHHVFGDDKSSNYCYFA